MRNAAAVFVLLAWQLQAGVSWQPAETALEQGRFEEATTIARRVIQHDAANSAAYVILARALIGQNDAADALQEATAALKSDANNVDALDYLSKLSTVLAQQEFSRLVALKGHDASEAIPYFRNYAERNPGDPRGGLAIGAAYFYAGKNEECKSEMQRLLSQGVTAGAAHYFLGRLAKIEGDLEEASMELKEAVPVLPDFADARAELGLVYTRRMEYSNALGELEKALRLDANNYLANTNLLILYRRMKDEKATAQAEKVKQLQNDREQKQALLMRTIEVRPY